MPAYEFVLKCKLRADNVLVAQRLLDGAVDFTSKCFATYNTPINSIEKSELKLVELDE